MNVFSNEVAQRLVSKTYIQQGAQNVSSLNNKVTELIEKQKLPLKPFSEQEIEMTLGQLSLMDSNNFSGNAGVGEREGRCYSNVVRRRNFGLTHGIGRSGDITEEQPKAAGSSLLVKLTKCLTLDAIKVSGIRLVKDCVLLPVATGMALTLCLLTLKRTKPSAKFVLFLRIDQKSCFKSISTAGLQPIVVNCVQIGDELSTDLTKLRAVIEEKGPDSILCVMSTTSCFAPRVPDNIPEVGKICSEFDIAHIVNNAYGLQSSKCCHLISETHRLKFRIDAFVQSMDKNFMVPVGGSVVASFEPLFTKSLGKIYPGRASVAPIVDLFITFLSMGCENYKNLLSERKTIFNKLQSELKNVAEVKKERLLKTPHNDISMAMSLQNASPPTNTEDTGSVTKVGSMLFTRFVSGARVVSRHTRKEIEGHEFVGFGAHIDEYPCDYLTAAASIGIVPDDVELFMKRLQSVLSKIDSTPAKFPLEHSEM